MLPFFLRPLLIAAVVTIFLGRSLPVEAQSCHAPSLRALEGPTFRATLGSVFATYENERYQGEYQGVHALLAFSHPRFFVDASLPYYRVVRNGLTEHGVGDVATDLRVTAFRWDDLGITLGPELALTLPTGDRARDLGMGHIMLMPGVFMMVSSERLTLIAQLSYGRAFADGHGHAEHAGARPIVNPMNRSELEHAFGLGVALNKLLRVTGRLLGAVPIADSTGVAREVAAVGLQLVPGPVDVSMEQHVPLLGQPFILKTTLSLGGQW